MIDINLELVKKHKLKKEISLRNQLYTGESYSDEEEFHSSLDSGSYVDVYKEMWYNEPIVGGILLLLEQYMKKMRWGLKSNDDKAASLVRKAFKSFREGWYTVLSDILTMLIFGFSVLEMEYDSDFIWEDWYIIRQEDIMSFVYRKSRSRIVDKVRLISGDEVPYYKFLLFKPTSARRSPFGRSILRSAYKPFFFKKHLEQIEGIGIERDFTGLPVLYSPPGINLDEDTKEMAAQRQWVVTLLKSLRRSEQDGVCLPDGWKLEMLGSPGQRQFDTNEIVRRYSSEIAVAMLGEFLILGLVAQRGSYNLASQQTQIFMDALEGWAKMIAMPINRKAIPQLLALHGFDTNKVSVSLYGKPLSSPNLKDLASFIARLIHQGAISVDDNVEDYVREISGLPNKQGISDELQ